jgi:hypothetical protein
VAANVAWTSAGVIVQASLAVSDGSERAMGAARFSPRRDDVLVGVPKAGR